MLKRYQVLIPDWLEEYIKYGVKRYRLSFSELIRLELCFSVLAMVCSLYPDYTPGVKCEEISAMIKESSNRELTREEIHRMTSKIYFEARKAIEFRMQQEKNLNP